MNLEKALIITKLVIGISIVGLLFMTMNLLVNISSKIEINDDFEMSVIGSFGAIDQRVGTIEKFLAEVTAVPQKPLESDEE